MKSYILLLIIPILFIFSSCGDINEQRVIGNGVITKKSYGIENFSTIKVSSSLEVYIKQADHFSIEVETDENLQDKVDIYEMDGVLYVGIKNGINFSTSDDTKVYISMPMVKAVKATGAVEIETDGVFNQLEPLELSLSGASEANLNIRMPTVGVTVSGAGTVKIKGESKEINLKASGASNINTSNLLTESVTASASGASHIKAFGSVSFILDASGASSIEYKGGGAVEKSKSSGASSIKPID